MFSKLAFVLLALVAAASSFPIEECSEGALPFSITIKNCDIDAGQRCPLIRGSEMYAEIGFTSPAGSSTLRPRVFATSFGFTFEYILPDHQANACDNLVGTNCPVDAGEDIFWSFEMPVSLEYPITEMILEIIIENADSEIETCVIVHAETQD